MRTSARTAPPAPSAGRADGCAHAARSAQRHIRKPPVRRSGTTRLPQPAPPTGTARTPPPALAQPGRKPRGRPPRPQARSTAFRDYQKNFPGRPARPGRANCVSLDLTLMVPATAAKAFDGTWMTHLDLPGGGRRARLQLSVQYPGEGRHHPRRRTSAPGGRGIAGARRQAPIRRQRRHYRQGHRRLQCSSPSAARPSGTPYALPCLGAFRPHRRHRPPHRRPPLRHDVREAVKARGAITRIF